MFVGFCAEWNTAAGDRLKQKVLGKQEVFYGGKIFSGKSVAPPASKAKDNKILERLSTQSQSLLLKEQAELQARKNDNQFQQRLLTPTAGNGRLPGFFFPLYWVFHVGWPFRPGLTPAFRTTGRAPSDPKRESLNRARPFGCSRSTTQVPGT